MKQISKTMQTFFFDIIFPRGKQYVHDDSSECTIKSTNISERKIRICFTENNTETVVILAHPYLANAKQFFQKSGHIDLYKKLGVTVVIFDFNGFGETPFADFHFEKDIKIVYEWVFETLKPNKCILHGISFGASQIIRSGDYITFNNSYFIIENCLDKGIHYFQKRKPSVYRFLKTLYFFIPRLKDKDDFVSGIQKCKNIREILFIYGTNDELTTPEMGVRLFNNCTMQKQFIELPGGHLEGILQGEKYEQILAEFVLNRKWVG